MDVIKVCSKHGNLTEKDCFIRTEKRWRISPKKNYSCKKCKKESSDKYRSKTGIKERMAEKNKIDRKINIDRIRKTRKIYVENNREKINEKEKQRRYRNLDRTREISRNIQKKWREDLHDNYIKSQLKTKFKLKASDAPDWIIKIKREIIKLRREIRKQKGLKNDNR